MKVKVRNKNGDIQYVPEHWVNHPVLGAGFQPVTQSDKTEQENNSMEPTNNRVGSSRRKGR